MKYEAIIYDLDGTLLDTIAMNMYPLIKIIKEELGIEKTFEEVKHCFSMTGKRTLDYWGIDYERVYPRWVQYVNEYEKGAVLFEDVVHILKLFKKAGIKQAACSAKTYAQYEIDMQIDNLKDYMDTVVLFEDTKKHKPDAEPLWLCVERLGISQDKVLYVGDALADGLACQSAGIDFAWAKWAGIEVENMPKAKYVLHSVKDLWELMQDE